MSHVVTKDGRRVLYVFYNKEIDDYDDQIAKALREHNLQDEPINIICKPAKAERTAKEKAAAL